MRYTSYESYTRYFNDNRSSINNKTIVCLVTLRLTVRMRSAETRTAATCYPQEIVSTTPRKETLHGDSDLLLFIPSWLLTFCFDSVQPVCTGQLECTMQLAMHGVDSHWWSQWCIYAGTAWNASQFCMAMPQITYGLIASELGPAGMRCRSTGCSRKMVLPSFQY